jgi:hypothetical protein
VEWQWSSKRIFDGTLAGFRYVALMASLVGLRERRDRVIARLTECYERDLLDIDELDRLLDQAHAATTLDQLDALVAGLEAAATIAIAPHAADDATRLGHKRLTVVCSHVERTGRWVVPRRLITRAVFGNIVLDLRDASIGAGTTTIELMTTFGNLELIVPPWLAIDVDVDSIGGSVEECHRVTRDPDPAEPLVYVTGAVRFGNLTISTRLPGETRSEAYKRQKRERHELARRALERGQM